MNDQNNNHDKNVGTFGIGALIALAGNSMDLPVVFLIGLAIAAIGFFTWLWYV